LGLLAGPRIASAQTPTADEPSPFRFQLEQANGPRGLAVDGYMYNDLRWHITNVRVRVDSVDANGTVTASTSGWVMGHVKGGGRCLALVVLDGMAEERLRSMLKLLRLAAVELLTREHHVADTCLISDARARLSLLQPAKRIVGRALPSENPCVTIFLGFAE
jgi:hypothetical protein